MTAICRKQILGSVLSVLLLVYGADRAIACPNCKEAVSLQGSEVANVAAGYNWSVIFMLVVPFSMLGTGALAVHRAVKRGLLPEM